MKELNLTKKTEKGLEKVEEKGGRSILTRSSAVAERPRDASCH